MTAPVRRSSRWFSPLMMATFILPGLAFGETLAPLDAPAPPAATPVAVAPVTAPATPVAAPVTMAPVAPSPSVTQVATTAPRVSRWKLLLTGFLFSTDNLEGIDAQRSANRASYGGLVGLGYEVTPIVGFNLYGGAHYARGAISPARAHVGIDVEVMPFGLRIGSLELIDLGLIAGFSNAIDGSPPHAGLRGNANFGTLAITASLRANGRYVMFETGVVTHL